MGQSGAQRAGKAGPHGSGISQGKAAPHGPASQAVFAVPPRREGSAVPRQLPGERCEGTVSGAPRASFAGKGQGTASVPSGVKSCRTFKL